ncbi:MAG: hypothetical protein KBS74_04460 [Clostridiales bacterium]|nr:hypothetical protein [Candidatus Cacconaster stercorequi]
MFGIARILFLIVIIVALVVFVYYLLYSRRINAKIASEEIEGRRMIDIPSLIRTVVIVALIIYALIITITVISSEKQESVENRDGFSVIDLSDYTYSAYDGTLVDTDASYVKNYSRESNEGYQKNIVQDGDFTFTAFTRTGEHDVYHPDFFCFVDYTGEDGANLSLYEYYEFIDTITAERYGGIGSGGGIEESFLIIGNINETESFKITLSLLDGKGEESYSEADRKAYEEDKGNFPSAADYALSTGSVVITVQ